MGTWGKVQPDFRLLEGMKSMDCVGMAQASWVAIWELGVGTGEALLF